MFIFMTFSRQKIIQRNGWRNKKRFWNEQYLLEAILTNTNRGTKVIAALNFLKHHHYDSLKRVCPYLTPDCEPGSFYFRINAYQR